MVRLRSVIICVYFGCRNAGLQPLWAEPPSVTHHVTWVMGKKPRK
jgi:hypothetical protein